MNHETRKPGLTEDFFKDQILRLRKNYGDASYPDESVKALWALLKHVSKNRFDQTINRILAENVSSKYPPGIDRIEKALESVREDDWAEQKEKAYSELSETFEENRATLKQVSTAMNKILNDITKV